MVLLNFNQNLVRWINSWILSDCGEYRSLGLVITSTQFWNYDKHIWCLFKLLSLSLGLILTIIIIFLKYMTWHCQIRSSELPFVLGNGFPWCSWLLLRERKEEAHVSSIDQYVHLESGSGLLAQCCQADSSYLKSLTGMNGNPWVPLLLGCLLSLKEMFNREQEKQFLLPAWSDFFFFFCTESSILVPLLGTS